MFSPNNTRQALSSIVGLCLLVFAFGLMNAARAQSATATLSGTVVDAAGGVVPNATVTIRNASTAFERSVTTNDEGFYTFQQLSPSAYTVRAERSGFAPVEIPNVVLNVGDLRSLRIELSVGQVTETVNVNAEASLVDESPAVSTVVDRQFVENLPLNGRSFQTLIALAPGVVLTKSNQDVGQFSVNGQRADANYFTVDGVSANVGVNTGPTLRQSGAGALPGLTALGGTNNLVSVDALQEFTIQTSVYASEFGRQPGGQISLVTRSGTNRFTGTLFEYFRNDALDANDFFANRLGLRRPPLRQNQFGGVLGGPLFLPRFGEGGRAFHDGRDRTFFFFSYEGLRLRQPQVTTTVVPTSSARRSGIAALQPFLNAYPLPNGRELGNGIAEFSASFSNPATLDATSLRLDHTLNSRVSFFGRYNYAPSESEQRRSSALSNITATEVRTHTLTLGANAVVTPAITNETRFNYSHNAGRTVGRLDAFGGATPFTVEQVLSPVVTTPEAQINFGLDFGSYLVGANADNLQRQINVVDNLSIVAGEHALKFGVDYRRLTPVSGPNLYNEAIIFDSLAAATAAVPRLGFYFNEVRDRVALVFHNFSVYGQDTWRATRRLTLTYGLRYELAPPPRGADARQQPFTVRGLDNPATINFAPPGTPLYRTSYTNFAPRVGAAYQLAQTPGRETVLRGGFGIFYDLGTGVIASASSAYPFSRTKRLPAGTPYPLTPEQAAPLPLGVTPFDVVRAFDPELELPRTYGFNLSVEQSLGRSQTVTASYVGALGRELLRQENLSLPNPSFRSVQATRNLAESDYHALQLQFQRRLARGFQALASYTFAKSLDNASNDSNLFPRSDRVDVRADRGPSDFDVRHSFNAAVTYNIPTPSENPVARRIFGGFAADAIFYARSATPVDVGTFRNIGFGFVFLRPDLVTGVPLHLEDANAPGGRRFNRAAFVNPTELLRQGNLGRNALRGFPVYQLDFALRRQFNLTERTNLQLRAEAFNLFNHPNFADPASDLGSSFFGVSRTMLRSSLGGLNALYQIGGPRSIQLALRLSF